MIVKNGNIQFWLNKYKQGSYDLPWHVSDEPSHFRDEVGKHGQGAHHVEHYEHFAHVSLRVDITVANLQIKEENCEKMLFHYWYKYTSNMSS